MYERIHFKNKNECFRRNGDNLKVFAWVGEFHMRFIASAQAGQDSFPETKNFNHNTAAKHCKTDFALHRVA